MLRRGCWSGVTAHPGAVSEHRDTRIDDERIHGVEEPQRRHRVAEPREEHLRDTEQKEAARPWDPWAAEPARERYEDKDDHDHDDDRPDEGMGVEAVGDRLPGDRVVVVGLARRVEGAVAGERDLDDDRDEEQRRHNLERVPHGRDLNERCGLKAGAYALQPEPQPPTWPGSVSSATWNEWPQPQLETAFGLSILKPDSWIVSR